MYLSLALWFVSVNRVVFSICDSNNVFIGVGVYISIGLKVVGTAGTEAGLTLVKKAGADSVINHRESGYISQLDAGEKFDIILEMLANINLVADLSLMKPEGRTVVSPG